MPALPADIAQFTNDGVVVTSPTDPTITDLISSNFIDAQHTQDPLEVFFDNAADAQLLLDERFLYQKEGGPVHVGIEVDDGLTLGLTTDVVPTVPTVQVYDEPHKIATLARVRGYALNMETDKYAIEAMA